MGDTNLCDDNTKKSASNGSNRYASIVLQNNATNESPVFPCSSVPLPHVGSTTTISSDSNGHERSTWSHQLDFFLSCVGYAVGLGNIWRFPYLCYKSGGGAFFIPYFFFLLVCGVPLFFLEMSLGQFGSRGPLGIWKICPIFKGLGYGMAIVSAVVCVYYNVIIAWALYYVYQSYSVAWSTCENSWNTPNCISKDNVYQKTNTSNPSKTLEFNNSSENFTEMLDIFTNNWGGNSSGFELNSDSRLTSSAEFWFFKVLHQSSGIEIAGNFQWPLVLTLFLAWVLVFLCVLKGIKSSGKVVYVTATFPYVVLICLLVRGLTLPGAMNGIYFYLSPKWEKLLTFEVWGAAATQIFYSVGAGWGALLTMASYNKFNNNVYRDSIAVPLINCGTSVLAGFVVFSVIGFMAFETGKNIEDVAQHGPGLAFIVYPEAIALLPVSPVWAFLFFFMLVAVGLDTQFGMFETAISALMDEFPDILKKRKMFCTASLCLLLFLLGLPCVTQGGVYVVELMDWYSAAFSLMVISLLETVAVSWIYGIDRFMLDISLMTKKVPSLWWKLCWCFITPFTIIALLLFILITHTSIKYNDYVYPSWSICVGWLMALCSIVPIPIVGAIKFYNAKGTIKEKFLVCISPSQDWGPALEEHKMLYKKSLSIVPSTFSQFPIDTYKDSTNMNGCISNEEMNEMLPVKQDNCV